MRSFVSICLLLLILVAAGLALADIHLTVTHVHKLQPGKIEHVHRFRLLPWRN